MSAVSSAISHEYPPASRRSAEIVCHCLRITRDEIHAAIDAGEVQSVKCVIRETQAGSGCTACHCTIRRMLAEAQSRSNSTNEITGPTLCAATLSE